MTMNFKNGAIILGLIAGASLTLAERAENRDSTLRSLRVEPQPNAPQGSSLASSGFLSQQAIGAVFDTPPPQHTSTGERSEKTARVEVADGASVSDGSEIDLEIVERVRLRFWGMTEASGEYSVEQGVISIPGVGRVSVIGRTPSALEAQLSTRLTAVMRREVNVSVEIARYNPFYASGLVARPGAIDWRPGLTLIQAVALAGGVVRGSGHEISERPTDLGHARTHLQFALAQYERLKAERDGVTAVRPSARLRQLSETSAQDNKATLSNFVARQNMMLEEQKASLDSQVASLEREKTAALKEVEAAEVQSRVAAQQAGITRQLLDGLNQLKAQGNIANARYLAQQNEVLTAEVRLAESRALVERARARVASIERQMTILRQERRATLNERIEALEREIAQYELTLAATGGARTPEGAPAVEFNIARKSQSGMSTIPATLFTEIKPGDVLIVSKGGDSGMQTASAPSVPGDRATAALQRAQRVFDASTVSTSPGQGVVRSSHPMR